MGRRPGRNPIVRRSMSYAKAGQALIKAQAAAAAGRANAARELLHRISVPLTLRGRAGVGVPVSLPLSSVEEGRGGDLSRRRECLPLSSPATALNG